MLSHNPALSGAIPGDLPPSSPSGWVSQAQGAFIPLTARAGEGVVMLPVAFCLATSNGKY